MRSDSRIYVAGHRGLVGSAVLRKLRARGHTNIIVRDHRQLDLLDQAAVRRFFKEERIEFAIIAAGHVGGIHANLLHQADFLYDNLMIAANTIHSALEASTEKLLFLGSSCIYPRAAAQPMREDALLTGAPEPTNEGYALAKIAGLKLCEMIHRQYGRRFISAMPTNLYGPGDRFHPTDSHVIPGLLRRFHEAKTSGAASVSVWGTGNARREFLHADDLAEAIYLLMLQYEEWQTINIGSGEEVTIRDLARMINEVTGFSGAITFDSTQPEGAPRKLLDSRRIFEYGWRPAHALREGLAETYAWALEQRVFDLAA